MRGQGASRVAGFRLRRGVLPPSWFGRPARGEALGIHTDHHRLGRAVTAGRTTHERRHVRHCADGRDDLPDRLVPYLDLFADSSPSSASRSGQKLRAGGETQDGRRRRGTGHGGSPRWERSHARDGVPVRARLDRNVPETVRAHVEVATGARWRGSEDRLSLLLSRRAAPPAGPSRRTACSTPRDSPTRPSTPTPRWTTGSAGFRTSRCCSDWRAKDPAAAEVEDALSRVAAPRRPIPRRRVASRASPARPRTPPSTRSTRSREHARGERRHRETRTRRGGFPLEFSPAPSKAYVTCPRRPIIARRRSPPCRTRTRTPRLCFCSARR